MHALDDAQGYAVQVTEVRSSADGKSRRRFVAGDRISPALAMEFGFIEPVVVGLARPGDERPDIAPNDDVVAFDGALTPVGQVQWIEASISPSHTGELADDIKHPVTGEVLIPAGTPIEITQELGEDGIRLLVDLTPAVEDALSKIEASAKDAAKPTETVDATAPTRRKRTTGPTETTEAAGPGESMPAAGPSETLAADLPAE